MLTISIGSGLIQLLCAGVAMFLKSWRNGGGLDESA
jgi:hypothetical protein